LIYIDGWNLMSLEHFQGETETLDTGYSMLDFYPISSPESPQQATSLLRPHRN